MTDIAIKRPRVFVSSTIRDLRDARSAVRHWLESAGYDVQLSEYNDFDRRPEAYTFEACFANVGTCDYYILLVGSARGSWYKKRDRLTVTRQEFRVARQRAAQGLLKMIVFVRGEVRTALRQWDDDGRPTRKSKLLADPKFTDEFLTELSLATGPGEGSGSQWINEFNDFRDIVDVLRKTLRLDTDLAGQLLRENLLRELLYNLTQLAHKTKDGEAAPHHMWTVHVRGEIIIRSDQLRDKIWLTSRQLGRGIGLIGIISESAKSLRRSALREAIRLGLFVEVDPLSGEFRETETRRALLALDKDLGYLLRNVGSEYQKQLDLKFATLARQANTGELGLGAYVEAADLVIAISLHNAFENVFEATTRLAQWLMGVVSSPSIRRNPISPIEGMAEAIEAESFAPGELKELLKKQVFPFGQRLTRALAEIFLADRDLVPRLRAILPPDAAFLSDDQVRAIAEEAVAHFTVADSRTEG